MYLINLQCVIILLAILSATVAFAHSPDIPERTDAQRAGQIAQAFNSQMAMADPGIRLPRTKAISSRVFNGRTAGENFGYSVASAGDVNGDGYADIIVGAVGSAVSGANTGRAYLFFGGVAMDDLPDVVLTGESGADWFGTSVAGVGDLNGDGFADIVVGASSNDAGGADAGRAYIFFGGSKMDSSPDLVLTGASAGDNFGKSVASAGDVNGDGYYDVIIGAHANDAKGSNAGRAFIYFGGSQMDTAPDVVLDGSVAGDHFGFCVASAGDVNGDGFDDVIVGKNRSDIGRVYVYFGGVTMDSTPDADWVCPSPGDNFGKSVASAGDVNGDGYSDIIVGAPLNPATGTFAGRADIYYGGVHMHAIPDVVLTGELQGDNFGRVVASVGDVNGDGYADVVVGAYGHDGGGTDAGRAYIYWGGLSMDNIPDAVLSGQGADDYFGFSAASAGDVNGDGYPEILLSAYGNDEAGVDAGRVYLYTNTYAGVDIPDLAFTGTGPGRRMGYRVASAGDINGDGFGDFLVTESPLGPGEANPVRVLLHLGGPLLGPTPNFVLYETELSDFGISLSPCTGDVNGDGFSDIIIGIHNASANWFQGPGYVRVYFGGPAFDTTADVVLRGADVIMGGHNDHFGCSVASGGDVNGDGYDDIVVGAPGYNDTDTGRVYVYFGGATIDTVRDVVLSGAIQYSDLPLGEKFGSSVAVAGDVNGDGYADLLVGSTGKIIHPLQTGGRFYLYHGGGTILDPPQWHMGSPFFGSIRVSSAGDIDHDGLGDFAVALGDTALLIMGTTGSNVRVHGLATGPALSSVAYAGDINGDGYSDCIIGTYDGRGVQVFLGGKQVTGTPDIMLRQVSGGEEFGFSVASAGDVNGDGVADIVVGAPSNDAGGEDAGRAYLYLSSPPAILPRITSASDVPGDQGGKVTLTWTRTAYDGPAFDKLVDYVVQRSAPPGVTGFHWQPVTTIAGTRQPKYTFTAPTTVDSGNGISGTNYFRVAVRTYPPVDFLYSQPVAARSIDNLPPAGVSGLTASFVTPTSIGLHWPANTGDADLGGYVVYRSTSSNFIPAESNRIATVADTSYLDGAIPSAPIVYYRLRAKDIHGNLSASSPQAALGIPTTQSFAVNTSWNMVSVPMLVADFQKETLYPTALSDAFSYDKGYAANAVVQNGKGYWLKFPSAQTVSLTGRALTGLTISVKAGWNMIGSIGAAVPVTDVVSNPPGLAVSPFYTYTTEYVAATAIEPHRAYWVKAVQDGELTLAVAGGATRAVRIVETREMPPDPPFLTSVAKDEMPTEFGLDQNYPNPFNPVTIISYQLPVLSSVLISVYDNLGQQVALLVNEPKAPGRYEVRFDGSGLASGVYFCRMHAGSFVETRKLMLLR